MTNALATIRRVEDPRACRELWRAMMPAGSVFDQWELRACFERHYGYRRVFLVAEDAAGKPLGLAALCEIADRGYLGCWPGEHYHGRTWLERNRLVADCDATAAALLDACGDAPVQMRYLEAVPGGLLAEPCCSLDEIGYTLCPGHYGWSFEGYMNSFSGKSRKKLARELEPLERLGVEYRLNRRSDAEAVFEMNLAAFGEGSYFADPRFLAGFRDLVDLLDVAGRLRVTCVLLGGRVAAVDLGAVYKGAYTVLAGGADPQFLGVAKLINFHHLRWACENQINEVDFLCGDFGWKERFHLAGRPLYMLNRNVSGLDGLIPAAAAEAPCARVAEVDYV